MILLDTHVLLWWASGDKSLSVAAANTIATELADQQELLVSSISIWEIAMLINKQRIALSMDIDSWVAEISQVDGVRFIPVDNEIALKSTLLPGIFHADPADRMIVATARKFAAPLLTADAKIRDYQYVKTIW